MPDQTVSKLSPSKEAALAIIERVDPEFSTIARRVYQADEGSEGLTARERAVIEMVVYGNVSYYEPTRLKEAMSDALEAGATSAELARVVELTAVMGYHGVAASMPHVLEHLAALGHLPGEVTVPAATRKNIESVMQAEWANSGPTMLNFAQASPRLADLMVDWTRIAWFSEVVDRKLRELIYLVFDAQPTHIFYPGLSAHVLRALEVGATAFEVAQVLEITLTPTIDRIADSFRLVESLTRPEAAG